MFLNLAELPPPTARLVNIPDGIAGVRRTLKHMVQLTRVGKLNLNVRLAAIQILEQAGLLQRDRAGIISALHEFVRDRIRYVNDIRGVETLQQPERTLELRAGDCDDKSILLASLLEALGYKTRFHAVGFQPGVLSHVFPEVWHGTGWLPLETTEFWEPGRGPDAAAHMVQNV
jgi:transglutaminase-like putative cysteine protease